MFQLKRDVTNSSPPWRTFCLSAAVLKAVAPAKKKKKQQLHLIIAVNNYLNCHCLPESCQAQQPRQLGTTCCQLFCWLIRMSSGGNYLSGLLINIWKWLNTVSSASHREKKSVWVNGQIKAIRHFTLPNFHNIFRVFFTAFLCVFNGHSLWQNPDKSGVKLSVSVGYCYYA